MLVVSGDWLDGSPTAKWPVAEQIEWVSAWCSTLPCLLATCSGNHDVVPAGEGLLSHDLNGGWLTKMRCPGRILVDGDDIVTGGIRVVCKPWRGGVLPVATKKSTALICHEGPAESMVVGRGVGESGDLEVADFAAKLKRGLILSGHVHCPVGWHDKVGIRNKAGAGTHCFNPGAAPWSAPVPNMVEIDTDRGFACYHRWDGYTEMARI